MVIKNPRLHIFHAIILLIFCAIVAIGSTGCSQPEAKTAPPEKSAAAIENVEKKSPPAAAGDEIYNAKKGESPTTIARALLRRSSFMTVAEFEAAIRQQNALGDQKILKSDATLKIPGMEPQPVVEHSRKAERESDFRAIYLTGSMAGSAAGIEKVRRWKSLGGNAVVFDVKDSDGSLSIAFDHPLAPRRRNVPLGNLPKFVRFLHQNDMHAIARIALFRDEHIATAHPELAIHSRASGAVWLENGAQVWTDPSHPDVQAYNIALAKFVAASGADEIQFDYVRFPAEGDQKDAKFAFESQTATGGARLARKDVITGFLEKAYRELHGAGVLLSLDVFGVMAWQRPVDLSHTGQEISEMAKFCDVLSPMIYPSHFFGMDGIASPGDAPEHFISESMERFRKIAAESGVVLRPWLQAFAWRTRTYSPEYIKVQVKAARDHGGTGFLLWNARNDYSKPYSAMPAMVADAGTYFGKAPAASAAAAPAQAPAVKKRPAGM